MSSRNTRYAQIGIETKRGPVSRRDSELWTIGILATIVGATALVVGAFALAFVNAGDFTTVKTRSVSAENLTSTGCVDFTNASVVLGPNVYHISRLPNRKWLIGHNFHSDLLYNLPFLLLGSQDVGLVGTNPAPNVTGYLYLTSGTVSSSLDPVSNPLAGVNNTASGSYYAEELWWVDLIQPETPSVLGRVAAVSPSRTSFVTASLHALQGGFNNFSSTIVTYPGEPNPFTLQRVRLTHVPFSTWVSNMDNHGHAIVKAKYAIDAYKTGGRMFLLGAELDPVTNTWLSVNLITDGPNLRYGDDKQIVTWVLSDLKPGALYGVVGILPTSNLVTHILNGWSVSSAFFLQELARSSGPFYASTFRMPYAPNYQGDISFAAFSCGFSVYPNTLRQMADHYYDFALNAGDFVYGDNGGSALLNFNIPNNAGAALGFDLGMAYHVYPTQIAPFALTFPLTITTSNNTFILDGVQKTIPNTTYATSGNLITALSPLFGSAFEISFTVSTQLNVTRTVWSTFGFSELYRNRMLNPEVQIAFASTGMYHLIDDNDISNDFHTVSVSGARQGNSSEIALSAAVQANSTASLYRINYAALQASPASVAPVRTANLDVAIGEANRHMPRSFVGAASNNATGYVRWGQVEIIKLDSAPFRNATAYEYYQEQGKFMSDTQLNFMIDRLTNSDALVKVVVYSRQLSTIFNSFSHVAQLRAQYVTIATGMGYSAPLAAAVFDKLFGRSQANFVSGYYPWFNNTFAPSLAGMKNVFFITGGNHHGTISKLSPDLPLIELHVSGYGNVNTNGNLDLARNGVESQLISGGQKGGYVAVNISPMKRTIKFTIVSADDKDNNEYTFKIE